MVFIVVSVQRSKSIAKGPNQVVIIERGGLCTEVSICGEMVTGEVKINSGGAFETQPSGPTERWL